MDRRAAPLIAHLTTVAHAVGVAISAVWAPPRMGLLVAGFEVPHLHLHVIRGVEHGRAFDFANAARTSIRRSRTSTPRHCGRRCGRTGTGRSYRADSWPVVSPER